MAKHYQEENLEVFKDALWDFIMEHCEVLESGALFVKFHTKSRQDLEKRVKARWLYNYHREDIKLKEATKQAMQKDFVENRQQKRERYEENRRKGKRKIFWSNLLSKIGIKI